MYNHKLELNTTYRPVYLGRRSEMGAVGLFFRGRNGHYI